MIRQKIAEIIGTARDDEGHTGSLYSDEFYADQILALFPSLDGIVVEEECPDHGRSTHTYDEFPCPICKNKMTYTRQAEWGDISTDNLEKLITFAEQMSWDSRALSYRIQTPKDALTIRSGGRLMVKE